MELHNSHTSDVGSPPPSPNSAIVTNPVELIQKLREDIIQIKNCQTPSDVMDNIQKLLVTVVTVLEGITERQQQLHGMVLPLANGEVKKCYVCASNRRSIATDIIH
jgi:hypothetical protein